MDALDIIILIAVAVISLLLNVKKNNASKGVNTETISGESAEEIPYSNWPEESSLEKNRENYSKREEYFSYESTPPPNRRASTSFQTSTIPQQDNFLEETEDENIIIDSLNFSPEEISKGIIYSEILKRPDY